MIDDELNEKKQELPEKKGLNKGIYLLPNALTLAGLFAGFYAIIAAMKGLFEPATYCIFIGMIFDGVDGRVARLTKTVSEFGAQLDSLADLVTFGLAPAVLAYAWSLKSMGKIGWLCAFLLTACGALRLARFNAMIDQVDSHYFQGMPIPTSAAIISGFVWTMLDYGIDGKTAMIFTACLVTLTALLMVSNIPYHSFKTFDFKGRVPFTTIVLTLLLIVGIALRPDQILFYGFLTYGLGCPLLWLKQRFFRKQSNK